MVVDRRHRRGLEADLRPVRVQLLGDEHRHAGVRTLAHLGVVDDDRDGVVGPDAHEGVEREVPDLLIHLLTGRERRQVQAEDQPAAGEQAGAEEVAAADVDDVCHFATPFAARAAAAWIALRIRGYVPQRQMLPAMASSMSASEGRGLSRSSTAAAMI